MSRTKRKPAPGKKQEGSSAVSPKSVLRQFVFFSTVSVVLAAPWVFGLHQLGHRLVFIVLVLFLAVVWFGARCFASGADKLEVNVASTALATLVMLFIAGVYKPASTSAALYGALLWASFLALYGIFRTLKLTDSEKDIFAYTLIANTSLASLWGLMAYTQVVQDSVLLFGGRTSTAFLYPNATASFVLMGAMLAIVLGIRAQGLSSKRSLLMFVSITNSAALILTMSRGAYLALVAALIILLILWRREFWQFLRYVLFTSLGVAICSASVLFAANPLGFLIAIFFAAAVSYLESRLHPSVGARRVSYLSLGLVALIVVAWGYHNWVNPKYSFALAGGSSGQSIDFAVQSVEGEARFIADVSVSPGGDSSQPLRLRMTTQDGLGNRITLMHIELFPGATSIIEDIDFAEPIKRVTLTLASAPQDAYVVLSGPEIMRGENAIKLRNVYHLYLPYSFARRIQDMSVSSLSNDARFVFYSDGLTLFAKSPLLGQGAGTWRARYDEVQSVFYGATSIHSDFFEVALDVGLIGLAVYLLFLSIQLFHAFRGRSTVLVAFGVANAAFLIHSAGEALLAFPALYFAVFAMLGSMHESPSVTFVHVRKIRVFAVIALSISLLTASSFALGQAQFDESAHVREDAELSVRQRALVRAATFNPWDGKYRAALAQTYDASGVDKARVLWDTATRLEPNDAGIFASAGKWFAENGQIAEALVYYAEALDLQPVNVRNYEAIAVAAATAMLIPANESEIAPPDLAETVRGVFERFLLTADKLDKTLPIRSVVPFALTPEFHLAIGQASLVMGDFSTANNHLKAVVAGHASEHVRNIALLWLAKADELGGALASASYLDALLEEPAYRSYWEKIGAFFMDWPFSTH